MTLSENINQADQSAKQKAPVFTIPPKPILNKSESQKSDTLPKLQTSAPVSTESSLSAHIQHTRPVALDSPTILTTPVNQQIPPSQHTTPSSGLKHTNSISFNVPSDVEKSHRGSISARPSQVNIINGYPKISSPSSSRQPSTLTHPTVAHPTAQHSTGNITTARNPSVSSVIASDQQSSHGSTPASVRRTSPSPSSSRQGSSNGGDYLQFFVKSFAPPSSSSSSAGVAAGAATAAAAAQHDAGSRSAEESRSNSISSNISFHSPISATGSDAPDHPHIQEPISIQSRKAKNVQKAVVASPTGPVVPFTQYLQREDDNKIHILIGATGSVATIKVPLIIDKIQKIYGPEKVSIQLVVSKPAEHFLRGSKISTEVKIWRDSDEWSNTFGKPGDPILHVELRKWADIFLIAPLSANTLAKIANGLCDNLLTSIVRSWNPTIPILAAPAMNTLMYTHPMTKKHLTLLGEEFKFITVLKPVEKVLMCGDIGMGGMREWTDIVDIVTRKIKEIRLEKLKKSDAGAAGTGVVAEEDEEEDEEEESDDEDRDYTDNSSDTSDDSSSNSDEDEDELDDLDMELEDNPDAIKGSVDNLTQRIPTVMTLTGDAVTDHHFNSTSDLI